MKTLFFLLAVLLGLSSSAHGQYASFRSSGYLGFAHAQQGEYFYGGGGFALHYQHDFLAGRLIGAVEYRTVQWGNQLAANFGYDHPYWQTGPWRASVYGQLQGGSALFRQNGLFVWGAEVGTTLEWKSPRAFFALVNVGGRFTQCPAYVEYSAINSVWEIPISLGFGFKFGNRK